MICAPSKTSIINSLGTGIRETQLPTDDFSIGIMKLVITDRSPESTKTNLKTTFRGGGAIYESDVMICAGFGAGNANVINMGTGWVGVHGTTGKATFITGTIDVRDMYRIGTSTKTFNLSSCREKERKRETSKKE